MIQIKLLRGWTALVCLCSIILLAPGVEADQKGDGKNPLWEVKGRNNTVHFLGSIHFLKAEFYPLPAPIEDAYKRSEIVVFEVDIARMSEPQTMFKLASMGAYPPGETLRENVSKETYDLLRKRLREHVGVPGLLDSFRPWMAAVTLAVLELQRLGFNPEEGVDRYFHNKAKADGKSIRSLETVEFQMGLFTGLTAREQEDFLKQTLEDIDRFEEMFAELVAAWRSGNAAKLDEMILDVMKEYPSIYEKFLVKRNKDWMETIDELLKGDKDAFVVVGAAHLVGKDSVLDLLARGGYKARQK